LERLADFFKVPGSGVFTVSHFLAAPSSELSFFIEEGKEKSLSQTLRIGLDQDRNFGAQDLSMSPEVGGH
jgi:hypothetical protein